MSRIAAVAPALPEHAYSQDEITAHLAELIAPEDKRSVLARFHRNSGIATRHTVLPIEQYRDLGGFTHANEVWLEEGTRLAGRALTEALAAAGLEPADVDFLLFTSVTGVAAPSIDALLVPHVGLRSDVKRIPSFGLGCVAGAAGIARVHDYLLGHPRDVGVLISVELCSLTLQRDDASVANFVATGLFGDGAAAVVMVGSERAAELGMPGPDVVGTRSTLHPDSVSEIGFDVGGTGFRIVLSASVSHTAATGVPAAVSAHLAEHGLAVGDIGAWIAHPGGPRVLEAFERGLGLDRAQLAASWRSLDAVGNLSSASVLHVLAEELRQPRGSNGVVLALGPGVTSESVLLKWAS